VTLKADKRGYPKPWFLLVLIFVSAFWFYPASADHPLPYKPEPEQAATATPPPLPTPDGQVRQIEVPIIMYHHVAAPPPDADAIRRDLSVSPQAFEEQLRYLVKAGYQPITLRQLVMHLQTGRPPLPRKPVVLTFDDGYRDNYTHAYPLLKEYGFVATFFILSGPIDFGDREYMTWEQIELMSAEGMEIGDHSYSHPDLAGQPPDFITWQILAPREVIEAHTGQEVRFFCYPAGSYDRTVIDILKSTHFWGAVGTQAGVLHSSEHPFELKRLRVHSDYSLAQFAALLNVDW
jgi:peptidoglycan/xylan/chitin deacetylase (PgdA/CDA1 family)